MDYLLKATYQRGFDFVRVTFFEDDSAEFTAGGNVTEDEIDAIILAGGGNVQDWDGAISLH